MMKVKHLFSGMLAVLAVLLLTGCWEKDNPVRTSLDVDTSTLTLSVGETAVRMATSKAEDATITYTSSNPAVATVDQFGKVTALTEGETTITITMDETKKSWYAAKTITYEVVVKNVSAAAMANVDKATPLTLVAQADGKITVTFNNGITLANDIHYTINDGAEQTIAKNTSGSFDIEVKKGDVVQLYSINTSLGGGAVAGARGTTRAVDSGAKYINIRPSMKTEIYGNVMSLLKGKDNLEGATAIEAKNAFYGLFAGAENLVNNAERLLVLPATTLTEGCYQDMFNGCKGIEKAPELPAPKLEKNCYQEMFYDCAKLNSVTCLATDIKAENSTKDWLGKAGTEASTKTLTTLVDMTPDSDDGVPTSWMTQKLILVTGIKLNKTELKLFEGASETLVATVEPSNATDKTVTWTSDKPELATVDANGKVTAVAEGEATITAQAGDKTATCKVTMTKKTPATVTTAPTAITGIKAGEDKAIVTAGVADGGTMMYAVTNTNTQPTSTDGFSATVPKANDLTAGTYYVWYYVKADDTHVDSEISASGIEVTVAVAYTLLSAATASDVGKVVCAAGHLHTAKTAVPTGCTAVGILGKVTSTGHGLILALQDASNQEQATINNWTSVTTYASTTLKLLPDNTARGSLASYTTLGSTTVSNWCVAPKDDYVAIFTNLGSTTGNPKTYDDNVNAYITTGVGGSAMVSGSGSNPFYYWSATPGTSSYYGSVFYNVGWYAQESYYNLEKVRPVLGF